MTTSARSPGDSAIDFSGIGSLSNPPSDAIWIKSLPSLSWNQSVAAGWLTVNSGAQDAPGWMI